MSNNFEVKSSKRSVAGFSAFGFITAVLIVAIFVVIGVIFAVGKKPKTEKPTGEVEVSETIREQESKNVLGLNGTKEEVREKKREEIKQEVIEDSRSEAYKEYEKLSEEEKAKVETIPREYDVVDDINHDPEYQEELEKSLPASFNLEDLIEIPTKDQESNGLCWDFATTRSMETNIALLQNKNVDFSEAFIATAVKHYQDIYADSVGIDYGGSSFDEYVKANVLVGGQLLEKDMPYDVTYEFTNGSRGVDALESYFDKIDHSYVASVTRRFPSYLINDVPDDIRADFIREIKKHVMNYGSIYATINSEDVKLVDAEGVYAKIDTSSSLLTDHAISIIGWDDDYGFEESSEQEDSVKSGAFLAKNSWANQTEYIWISYDYELIYQLSAGIVSAKPEDGIKLADIENSKIRTLIENQNDIYSYDYNGEKYLSHGVKGMSFPDVGEVQAAGLGLTDEDMQFIIDNDMFPNAVSVDVSDNSLTNLNWTSAFKNLVAIDAHNNQITSLEGLPDNNKISFINLDNNNIRSLAPLETKNLPMNLSLEANQITEMPSERLMSSLAYLNLRFNNIRLDDDYVYDEGSYEGVISRADIQLLLGDNYELFIGEHRLSIDANIAEIDLSHTGLTSFDEIDLGSKLSWSTLYLNGNQLENLDSLDGHVSGFSQFDLSDNPLSSVDGITEYANNNLIYRKEDTDNRAPIAPVGFIRNAYAMELEPTSNYMLTLSLDNTGITEFDWLNGLPISALSLRNNNISSFSYESRPAYLRQLILDGNEGIQISGDMIGVTNLSLVGCGIASIEAITQLGSLSGVDLSDNPITDYSQLDNMDRLTSLYAERNMISALPRGMQYLDIDNSTITNDIDYFDSMLSLSKLSINNISGMEPGDIVAQIDSRGDNDAMGRVLVFGFARNVKDTSEKDILKTISNNNNYYFECERRDDGLCYMDSYPKRRLVRYMYYNYAKNRNLVDRYGKYVQTDKINQLVIPDGTAEIR